MAEDTDYSDGGGYRSSAARSSELSKGLLNTPLDKSKTSTRWVILVLACLMLVGSYYCFDIPAALKTQLDDWMGNPGDYEFNFGLLYTLYAAPNVILPFFGGFFVDKLGVRICLLVFSSLIALGQIIFCLGVSVKSWPIIFLGRLVFGLGGESFTVANSVLLADWFKGRELAFAFGINLSVAKLGSVINNILSPALAESLGLLFALWFGSILCGFGILCVVLTWPIDKRMDEMIAAQGAYGQIGQFDDEQDRKSNALLGGEVAHSVTVSTMHPTTSAAAGGDEDNEDGEEDDGERDIRRSGVSGTSTEKTEEWRHTGQGGTLAPIADRTMSASSIASSSDSGMSNTSNNNNNNNNDVSFKEVFNLSHIFWVLVISCMVVYGSVLPFNNISSSLLLERDYFKEPPNKCQLDVPTQCQSATNQPVDCPSSKWYQYPLPSNYTSDDVDCTDDKWSGHGACTKDYCDRLANAEAKAAVVMSIPYTISAILSPPLGYLVDMYGFRAVIAAIAPGILVVVHLLLGYTDCDAVIPLVGQGLAYTGFVSVLWPAVPLVVEDRVSGLAFGIVTSAQNLACAVLPLVIAAIYSDSNDKYIPNVELLFALLGGIGFLVGLYMNYYDLGHNSVLNRGFAAAEKAMEEEAAAMAAAGDKDPLLSAMSPSSYSSATVGGGGVAEEDSSGSPEQQRRAGTKKGVSFDTTGPLDIRAQSLELSDDESGLRRRSRASSRERSSSRGSRGSSRGAGSRGGSVDRGHRLSFSSHDEMLRGGAYRHKQEK